MKSFRLFFAFALTFFINASFAQGNMVKVGNAPTSKTIKVELGKFTKPSMKFNVGGVDFNVATEKQQRLNSDGKVEIFYVFKTKEAVQGSMIETDRFFTVNGKPQTGYVFRTAKPSNKTGKYSYYLIASDPQNSGHWGKFKISVED